MKIFEVRMRLASKYFEEERKSQILPAKIKKADVSGTDEEPEFTHPEIKELYQYGLYIPAETIRKILELPHDSLVQDLLAVLQDAINRYDYFNTMEWEEETHSFVIHSFFMLMEIGAVESLPFLFSFLSYESDFLNFWMGDHITATIWQCFYKLGFNETGQLKGYLLQPSIDTYSKTAVSEALCQIILHHPDRKDEIRDIFHEVLETFERSKPEDDLLDTDFLGLLVSDIMDANLPELLPSIKRLYEKGYVSIGIAGTYESVQRDFEQHARIDHKRKILGIFDLYNDIVDNWAGYNEDEEFTDDEFDNPYLQKPVISVKIGRNDPCPCGSGKKYKKCCLKE
jgi:hypothetical protein